MADVVSVTIRIEAPAATVYELVSDLPRMGEWSPENTGGKWLGGASMAATGAKFKGTNSNGSKQWSTVARVVEATPGKAFVFDVVAGPFKISRWSFRITAADGGCEVTETWENLCNPVARRIGVFVSGVTDRSTYTETSVHTTLERLKIAAEH